MRTGKHKNFKNMIYVAIGNWWINLALYGFIIGSKNSKKPNKILMINLKT